MKKAFLVVLMLSSSLIFAQDSISGSVSDADNNPIPGATIVVQGTNTGVVTDFDGNYQINASAGDQLTFSSLGFGSQTITVGNQNQINVTLMSSVDILDEVVVSGYQTQQRRSLSGSMIGGMAELQQMLNFCGEHNIVSDVEVIKSDYINTAYDRTVASDVKYRFVIDAKTF